MPGYLRTQATAAQLTAAITAAAAAVPGSRAPYDMRPMKDYVSDSIGDTRFVLILVAVFAALSVLLATVGLYATLAYLTAQRAREFGIRLALGSSVNALVAIVIRESAFLTVAGATIGLAGAAIATRAIRGLLYGVEPLDAVTLAGTAVLVGIVAAGAACVPAWRATRIDPQLSLRSDQAAPSVRVN